MLLVPLVHNLQPQHAHQSGGAALPSAGCVATTTCCNLARLQAHDLCRAMQAAEPLSGLQRPRSTASPLPHPTHMLVCGDAGRFLGCSVPLKPALSRQLLTWLPLGSTCLPGCRQCRAFPQRLPLPSPDSCCTPSASAPVQVMSRAPTEASAVAVACHDPRAGLVMGGHRVRAPRFLAPHPLVQAAAQVGPHTVSAQDVLAVTHGPAAEPVRPGHSTAHLAVLLLRRVSVAQEWCDAEPCTRWCREAQSALHCKLAAQCCIESSAV